MTSSWLKLCAYWRYVVVSTLIKLHRYLGIYFIGIWYSFSLNIQQQFGSFEHMETCDCSHYSALLSFNELHDIAIYLWLISITTVVLLKDLRRRQWLKQAIEVRFTPLCSQQYACWWTSKVKFGFKIYTEQVFVRLAFKTYRPFPKRFELYVDLPFHSAFNNIQTENEWWSKPLFGEKVIRYLLSSIHWICFTQLSFIFVTKLFAENKRFLILDSCCEQDIICTLTVVQKHTPSHHEHNNLIEYLYHIGTFWRHMTTTLFIKK